MTKQMTVGNLIEALELLPDHSEKVSFDFEEAFPTDFGSWRGYYYHLALGFDLGGYNQKQSSATKQSVGELLRKAREASTTFFCGWKGGEHYMTKDTPIWIANEGNSGNTALVGVLDHRYEGIVLLTEFKEYEVENN